MGMPGGIHSGMPLEREVLYESNLGCYLNFWGAVLFKTDVLSVGRRADKDTRQFPGLKANICMT